MRTVKPCYIKPETITEGDLIRVTRKSLDAEISNVGTVHKVNHHPNRVEYLTEQGFLLLVRLYSTDEKVTVTLLKRDEFTPTLW